MTDAGLIALFEAWLADIDSVPFKHEQWSGDQPKEGSR